MKKKSLKVKCRKCGKIGETEPPTTENEKEISPIIIWCDNCEDFTLADIIDE